MKNPDFLINGTIVVLKPTKENNMNTIAVVVGRYTMVVEGYPEYVGLPIILESIGDDDETTIKYLTQNKTMASYISFFQDEVLSELGVVKGVEDKEWVITKTINYLRDNNTEDFALRNKGDKVQKLEVTLDESLIEKNFTKFKWIIFNKDLDKYTLENWIAKLTEKKEFYTKYFDVKEKDIDSCITKLQKSLEVVHIRKR